MIYTRRLVLVSGLVSLFTSTVWADITPLGIDFRKNLFVQEIWEGDEPFYILFNQTDKEMEISVHVPRGGEQLAGGWKVAGNAFVKVSAAKLVGKELIEFKLGDGSILGLLVAPQPANWDVPPKKDEVRSNYGMNGSGGRQLDVWVKHPVSVKPNTEYTVEISLPKNGGLLMCNKKLEGLQKVESKTLNLKEVGDRYEIDVTKPKHGANRHTIELTFRHPEGKTNSKLMLDIFRFLSPAKNTGGHGVTRMVVVEAMP